ncbi:hypothetical protein B8Y17_003144 [Salmonella enterica subsp. enterica serovar Sandiego]|nr:hypothetical protein [Salmonella enterica subsp. enterica serovar Hull]EDT4893588.1 hypothetical protein [Salmonella enterica subsp. enterica serovar Sandiego]EIE9845199.1 hypothetical protein [Salmonella enterica]
MTTITKEWLQQTIAEFENTRDDIPFGLSDDDAKVLIVLKRALALLDAEPVRYLNKFSGTCVTLEQQPNASDDVAVYMPLYAAPPAPVVPEEMPAGLAGQIVSLLAHNIGDKFLAQKIWNACRAVMLQGGQPVSNRDELQVIGWLRSDYNSDDKRDPNAPLFMLGSNDPSDAWGVKYIPLSGNSPVIPGGWVMVPKKLTAENGAKSLLSGEFLETTFISCPECFADEECESCDGSGRIKIEVPVSWTTIKAIWNKGVEHFRSSTATGDN